MHKGKAIGGCTTCHKLTIHRDLLIMVISRVDNVNKARNLSKSVDNSAGFFNVPLNRANK